MIPQSFITQLLQYCDIEDVISSYVVLKKESKNKKGLCPFHSEKTPSMVVYPDTQSFFCFGCGTGGDAISFVMRVENIEYVEAIHLLANRVGLKVPEDGESDKTAELKSTIYEMNKVTAKFFYSCLMSKHGLEARKYFKERGLDKSTINKYGLGFAPDSWNALRDYLKSKGYTYEQMSQAYLITKGKNNSFYDIFRNRVIFPIIDIRGNIIAFGGRVLDDSKPKYLNTADTPVFKKSRNLFSLNFAKNSKRKNFILAEGYMDVIAVNSHGYDNVVATLGTALTAEQARIISKYTSEVVIAYDTDAAGQTATHRAINLLSEVGIKTKVLKMTGAKDPDEYIKKFGEKRFEILMDNAGNVIEFELNNLKKSLDLEDTNGKIEYIKKAVGILSQVKNPLEREIYANIVSNDTQATVQSILTQVNSIIKSKRRAEEKREWSDIQSNKSFALDKINPQKQKYKKIALSEEGIIAFLYNNNDYFKYIMSKISVSDFVTEFNRRVFEYMVNNLNRNEQIHLSMMHSDFSMEEHSQISKILVTNNEFKNTKETLDDYLNVLLNDKYRYNEEDIASMSNEEIEKLIQNKRKN